ncbi:MAG TPA: secretin N-terminal domain-containing protein [Arenibaculum sp.]|nr:secretin N-terminal domain-containing protein [Arenibaculum sp.]
MSLLSRSSFAVLSLALLIGACAERTGGRSGIVAAGPPEPAATRPNFAQALAQARAEAQAEAQAEARAEAARPPVSLGPMPSSRGLAAPEFYPGRGMPPLPPGDTAAAREAPAGDIDLDFVNADVREVVDAVLGEILGLGYAVDPSVQGTVTLRSTEPLARDDVLPVLENVLSLNGLALIRDGGLTRIVPLDRTNALAGAIAAVPPGARAAGFGTHVMPLDHADAEELRTTLQPFVPQNRLLVADRSRGLLLFTGTGAEARTLSDLVGALDVDLLAGKSFALIPLRRAAPEEVAEELDAVFATGAMAGQGGADGIVRFVPVGRLNAILVIAPNAGQVREAQTWIGRLDRGDSGSDRRLFVYRVQNGRAVDLAGTLDLLFSRQAPARRPRDDFELAPVWSRSRSRGASRKPLLRNSAAGKGRPAGAALPRGRVPRPRRSRPGTGPSSAWSARKAPMPSSSMPRPRNTG